MSREPFLTVREVADLLKVGEATVRRWIKEGELRAIGIGKGWRIGAEDLDTFLDGHATRPAGTANDGSLTSPDASGEEETKEP